LITKFLDGDERAFNLLVWHWQKPLFNFIYRYVGDEEEAKDLCQRTLIRVYHKLPQMKDHSKFSAWVHKIAANLCKDNLQDRRRNTFISIDDDEESSQLLS
jgi:RNA polymerase sigma-70 factor (ECF subfamily)